MTSGSDYTHQAFCTSMCWGLVFFQSICRSDFAFLLIEFTVVFISSLYQEVNTCRMLWNIGKKEKDNNKNMLRVIDTNPRNKAMIRSSICLHLTPCTFPLLKHPNSVLGSVPISWNWLACHHTYGSSSHGDWFVMCEFGDKYQVVLQNFKFDSIGPHDFNDEQWASYVLLSTTRPREGYACPKARTPYENHTFKPHQSGMSFMLEM